MIVRFNVRNEYDDIINSYVSNNMATVSDYLVRINQLTTTNLEILKVLNQAFQSKQDHLSVNLDGMDYTIPSFISLENKINVLQENFENLVHIHESGEAFVNLDGNSRVLELRGYTHTPSSLVLPEIETFSVEQNHVFKDFITPLVHMTFSMQNVPNDITQVNVKKVIPHNEELRERMKSELQYLDDDGNIQYKTSTQYQYQTLYKILAGYEKDTDYTEYDSIQTMPIRKNVGSGNYIVAEIISDEINENLENIITVRFAQGQEGFMSSLSYKLFDETIQRPLRIGDRLVTWDDSAKVEIIELRPSTNTIVFKVLSGEYLNLVAWRGSGQISDLSKMKFFSPVNFDQDKYIKVPLEEDDLIFVALAPLNPRLRVQAPWGTGLIINTFSLMNSDESFETYYKQNVQNLGDVLKEVSSVMSNTLSGMSGTEFNKITSAVPVVSMDDIQVLQINEHLDNSTTVQNIRSLYSQKKQYESDLNEIQTKINEINTQLAGISFDDTSDLRVVYTSQLSEYSLRKNELVASITKTIEAISQAANDSVIPIEAPKYRIRGFFDWTSFAEEVDPRLLDHICGIKVQYRYKNIDQEQGNAKAFGDKFIFSDWNDMEGFIAKRTAAWKDRFQYGPEGGTYNTNNINVPSFNQIDIPISQGETVDIRLRVIYDYGSPFVEVFSAWSEIVNVGFPDEFLKNVQVIDIIKENNNDIETNRFKSIISEQGIPQHINDKVTDQDITYFHKPESIASGFYTEERRIIPLKDKLSDMDNTIKNLENEIQGTGSNAIAVSLVNGDVTNTLYPFQVNQISVAPYSDFNVETNETEGSYTFHDKWVSTILNIVLTNQSDRTVKLFSLFPGRRDVLLNDLVNARYKLEHYCVDPKYGVPNASLDEDKRGVWINYPGNNEDVLTLQGANQFIYFRLDDINDGEKYYAQGDQSEYARLSDSAVFVKPSKTSDGKLMPWNEKKTQAYLYPSVREKYALCIESDTNNAYITLAPGEELIVPMVFTYAVKSGESISKTISFDIRTSLYQDPSNYVFQVTAKNTASVQDKLITTNRKNLFGITGLFGRRGVKYNTTVVK